MTFPRTPASVRRLSASELDAYFRSLHATALPVGTFKGVAWSHDLPWLSKVTKAWRGKVFEGATVRNDVAGTLVLPGVVTLSRQFSVGDQWGHVRIDYPELGLTDFLRPINDRAWLGLMKLGTSTVWFSLEQQR